MKRTNLLYFVLGLIILLVPIWYIYGNDVKEYFQTKDYVYWSNDVSITSADYEASIDRNSKFKIYWWHGLVLQAKDRKVINARAYAVFDKSKSWIKDTSGFELSNRIQTLKFDFYQIYAQKFNQEIDKARLNQNTKYEDLESIGDKIYSDLKIQEKVIFDSYTDHEERFQKWRPIIDSLLIHGIE